MNRDREWVLLATALHASGMVSSAALLIVPLLSVVGQLPEGEHATLAEVMNAYPNAEHLVEAEIEGKALKELIALQASLLSYQQARPFWLCDGSEVDAEQLEEQHIYRMVTTELVCEGGLGWQRARTAIISSRSLNCTCLQVVRDYLVSC